MKVHILALFVIGLICFFIGVFAAAAIIHESVHEAVFEAFYEYSNN